MTNRHQLEREPQPVVITTPLRDQLPVRVVQEEEPLQHRLIRRSRVPAIRRLLGGGQKTSHARSNERSH